MLYAQWRFRGQDPYAVLFGDLEPGPWPSRREAVLTAFATYAADAEHAALNFMEAFAGTMGG